MNNSIRKKIIEKIKNKKVRPRPKWQFILKNYSLWTIGVVSIIIGGLAAAITIYFLVNNDFDARETLGFGIVRMILETFPVFWLLALIALIVVAIYSLIHTKKAYKYNMAIIVIIILLVVAVFGFAFNGIEAGKRIDEPTRKMPVLGKVMNRRAHFWQMAERGHLGGKIISLEDDRLTIEDPRGNKWQVDLGDIEIEQDLNEPIRIIGEKTGEFEFKAKDILPWHPGKGQPPVKGIQKHRPY